MTAYITRSVGVHTMLLLMMCTMRLSVIPFYKNATTGSVPIIVGQYFHDTLNTELDSIQCSRIYLNYII